MEDWYLSAVNDFELYVGGFKGLNPDQQRNFEIKREHTLRVTANARQLATALNVTPGEEQAAVLAALFHDLGRFRQIAEYSTLDDQVSLDHAELSVEILKGKNYLGTVDEETQELVYHTILLHNKPDLPRNLGGSRLLLARLLRDADKLDILKVLTRYYADKNQPVNPMLTWDLPKSNQVSPGVAREILAGKLVSRKEVKNETDVKILHLSWVYDINFKPAVELLLRNRYLEIIYNALPKNDQVFEIYRKIKVYAENKMFE